jgi:hypothetical protein
MESELSGTNEKVYHRLFEHPTPHDLQWCEVRSMLGAIAGVQLAEDDKGHLRASRNGQTLILHRPRGKDLADKKELMRIRHFLERSGAPAPAASGTH